MAAVSSTRAQKGGGRQWSFSHFLLNAVVGVGIVKIGPLLEAVLPRSLGGVHVGEIVAFFRFPLGAFACGWWLPRGVAGASAGAAVMAMIFLDSQGALDGGATARSLTRAFTTLLPFLMLFFEFLGWFGRRVADKSAQEGSK